MNLNILWFVLIGVLYTGFFFLEGFEFGVGMLLPFVGKKDIERRAVINTIGPHWDGNEVWLIIAGGATFAAFPNWYGTLFSGFYLGMFLLLLALIFRGVAFEFRSKFGNPKWRTGWDVTIAVSSFLAAFLLGVVFTNLVKGVPIDENQVFTGTFFSLLNPLSILGGITVVGLFMLHGANFLHLKLTDALQERSSKFARGIWLAAFLLAGSYFLVLGLSTTAFVEKGLVGWILPVLAAVSLILTRLFIKANKGVLTFVTTGLAVVFTVASLFTALFPNVMVSSTSADLNLTIYNASSSPYTLNVMSIMAAVMLPIVLAYQVWTYWVFRRRIQVNPKTLTY
jgi:cytochrome d ubiquinol oxidase subunit II